MKKLFTCHSLANLTRFVYVQGGKWENKPEAAIQPRSPQEVKAAKLATLRTDLEDAKQEQREAEEDFAAAERRVVTHPSPEKEQEMKGEILAAKKKTQELEAQIRELESGQAAKAPEVAKGEGAKATTPGLGVLKKMAGDKSPLQMAEKYVGSLRKTATAGSEALSPIFTPEARAQLSAENLKKAQEARKLADAARDFADRARTDAELLSDDPERANIANRLENRAQELEAAAQEAEAVYKSTIAQPENHPAQEPQAPKKAPEKKELSPDQKWTKTMNFLGTKGITSYGLNKFLVAKTFLREGTGGKAAVVKAVEHMQTNLHVNPDGILGPKTFKKMESTFSAEEMALLKSGLDTSNLKETEAPIVAPKINPDDIFVVREGQGQGGGDHGVAQNEVVRFLGAGTRGDRSWVQATDGTRYEVDNSSLSLHPKGFSRDANLAKFQAIAQKEAEAGLKAWQRRRS